MKFKSLIYKYTGVYLAHKEENAYVHSKEYWKQLVKIAKNKKNDMGVRNIHGLMIGMWQAQHGFARPASFIRYRRPRAFFKIVGWFVVLFTVIQWDILKAYRRLKVRMGYPIKIKSRRSK